MTVIGDAPRPWVLGVGLTDEEADVLKPLCGRLVRQETEDRYGYLPEEFDVVIDFGVGFNEHDRVPYRLFFAEPPTQMGGAFFDSMTSGGAVYADPRIFPPEPIPTHPFPVSVPARRFEITDYARERRVERLVEESCHPGAGNLYVAFTPPFHPPRGVHALLEEKLERRNVLAAVLDSRAGEEFKPPSGALVWLPAIARARLKEWLTFAIGLWHEQAPDRFPINADWETEDQWASPDELEARDALGQFDTGEEARRVASAAHRAALAARLEKTAPSGVDARRLITADGKDLVMAVSAALETLGFTVTDADHLPEHKSAKQEDLRVQLGDWIALAEVKGYTKGAKSNDLNQISKAAATFALGGKAVDALWYVVNANRTIDPAVRDVPLQSDPDTVNSFSSIWNLRVIDTRELFRLRRAVQDGTITKMGAQEQLRSSGPWYKFSPEPDASRPTS